MKCGLLLIAAVALTFATTGCQRNLRQNGCQSCQNSDSSAGSYAGHGANSADYVPRAPHGYYRQQYQSQGAPPSASVAYPYYTTRAPRDFLLDNPPSIGY